MKKSKRKSNVFICKIKEYIHNISYKDIIIFLIPILISFFYMIFLYPGVLSYDSYNQLNQIKTGVFVNSHPFLHTWMEMVLLKIWDSAAIISLFQIIVFSLIWTSICKYNRKKDTLNVFLIQLIITVIIFINPLNSVMSMTLWKDIMFSYLVLLLCFQLQKAIDKKFILKKSNIVYLSLILILIPNFRHNGLAITSLLSILLFIFLLLKDKKSKNYWLFAASLLIFFGFFKLMYKVYDVQERAFSLDMYLNSKALFTCGYINREDGITKSEIDELNRYIDFDRITTFNKNINVDYALFEAHYNNEYFLKNKSNFYKTVFSIMWNHKLKTLEYWLNEAKFIWSVPRYYNERGITFTIRSSTPFENLEKYDQVFISTVRYNHFEQIYYLIVDNLFLCSLFFSGPLYLYISILLCILLSKKNKYAYVLLLPVIVNLIGLLPTIPSNDVRYVYINMLTTYILLNILLSDLIINGKLKK